jgi:hypothetical protein
LLSLHILLRCKHVSHYDSPNGLWEVQVLAALLIATELVSLLGEEIGKNRDPHDQLVFFLLEVFFSDDLEGFFVGIGRVCERVTILGGLVGDRAEDLLIARDVLFGDLGVEILRVMISRGIGKGTLEVAIPEALTEPDYLLVGIKDALTINKLINSVVFKLLELLKRSLIDKLCKGSLLHLLKRR